MAEKFLEKYMKAENKIQEIITAGASDPQIKTKILSYIIEGVKDKPKYIAALQVYSCALFNSFVQKDDIQLKEIEKRLFSIYKKNKDDIQIVEQLSIILGKIYSLFINEKNNEYKRQFPTFFSELEPMFKQQDTLYAGLVLLKQVMVSWNDFYTFYEVQIIEHIKKGLNESDKQITQIAVLASLSILQQQPTSQLKQFNSLMQSLVQNIYGNLQNVDQTCIEQLEESVVAQSILFRKYFTYILEQLNKQLNDTAITSSVYEGALKSLLLLFDKQKKFLLTQHTNSSIKDIYSLIFDYLSTEDIQQNQLLGKQANGKSQIKLINIISNPLFSKTQFILKQLRDLSKIMTLAEVKDIYIQLFVEKYNKSTPNAVYSAFIAFSTLGEYKVNVNDLTEYVKLTIKKIKKGVFIEKFAALNGISFLCDFLGSKFTTKFQAELLKDGLLGSLAASQEERALIYQTLTLYIGNSEKQLEASDLKQLVEIINQDLKDSSCSESSKYYCLILIDLLIEKLNIPMKNYSDDLYNLIKKLKSDNLELNCMKFEVQANFIMNYNDNKHIYGDVDSMLTSAVNLDLLKQLEGAEQFELLQNQMNVLYKITLALESKGALSQKGEQIVSSTIPLIEQSIKYLIQKKQRQEDDDEEELEANQESAEVQTEIDVNAPRKAFQLLRIIYEQNPKTKHADNVLKLGLEVLSDLNDHLNLRDSVIDILPSLFKVLKESGSENLKEGVYEMVKALVNNMQAETDHGVVLDSLELIYKTIEQAGKCFDAETVKSVMVFLFEICQNSIENIDSKTEVASSKRKDDSDNENDDDDDEDDEDEEEEEEQVENKEQLELAQAIGPIIELLYRTHTEEAYESFDDIICERVMGLCDSEDENFKLVGYNILSNLLTILNYDQLKDYIDEFFAYLTEGIESEMYSLKQSSVYGLGLLCQVIPKNAFKQYKLYISEAIVSCILHEPEGINLEEEEMDEELEEEFTLFIDNSIAALARLVKYQDDMQEAGPFIDLLPIKIDEEEGLIAHEIFADLVLENKFADEFNKEIKESVKRIQESEFINESISQKLDKILKMKKFSKA